MSENRLDPLDRHRWNEAKARHLLNRAGFGIPNSQWVELASLAPGDAVRRLVDYEGLPADFREPDFLFEPLPASEVNRIIEGTPQEAVQKAGNALRDIERENIGMLRAWWLRRMLTTAYPLQEKLALCWHGHFATSAAKVESAWANYQLNRVFREQGSGNLLDLVVRVGQSPAMLEYLDNNRSTKNGPNENWARELLELFTLGIGHYTEADVKEAARAFTGWSSNEKRFTYRDYDHDDGPKEFLGARGLLDGWDVIEIIFEQEACARHFAKTLWEFFVYEDPPLELVDGLAKVLRRHNYALRPMLRTMFMSKEFYSARSMGQQVKSPVQLVVEMVHKFGMEPPPYAVMMEATAAMGQDLFSPPNVKGWDGGRAWINTSTLVERYSLAAALATAEPLRPGAESNTMMASRATTGLMPDGADFTGSLQRLLAPFPKEKQKYIVDRLGFNRSDFRQMAREFIDGSQKRPPWNPRPIFSKFEFGTAGECVLALEREFLSAALSDKQRRILLNALGAESAANKRCTAESLTTDQMNATLYLLFSLAEYQLC